MANSRAIGFDSTMVESPSKTKYQIKILSSDVTSNGTISDLSFNNLEIGKIYRFTMKARFTTSTTSVFVLEANNSGNLLDFRMDQGAGGGGVHSEGGSVVFVAAATTLTVSAGAMTSDETIHGNGDKQETFVILEELPNHEVTTDWT